MNKLISRITSSDFHQNLINEAYSRNKYQDMLTNIGKYSIFSTADPILNLYIYQHELLQKIDNSYFYIISVDLEEFYQKNIQQQSSVKLTACFSVPSMQHQTVIETESEIRDLKFLQTYRPERIYPQFIIHNFCIITRFHAEKDYRDRSLVRITSPPYYNSPALVLDINFQKKKAICLTTLNEIEKSINEIPNYMTSKVFEHSTIQNRREKFFSSFDKTKFFHGHLFHGFKIIGKFILTKVPLNTIKTWSANLTPYEKNMFFGCKNPGIVNEKSSSSEYEDDVELNTVQESSFKKIEHPQVNPPPPLPPPPVEPPQTEAVLDKKVVLIEELFVKELSVLSNNLKAIFASKDKLIDNLNKFILSFKEFCEYYKQQYQILVSTENSTLDPLAKAAIKAIRSKIRERFNIFNRIICDVYLYFKENFDYTLILNPASFKKPKFKGASLKYDSTRVPNTLKSIINEYFTKNSHLLPSKAPNKQDPLLSDPPSLKLGFEDGFSDVQEEEIHIDIGDPSNEFSDHDNDSSDQLFKPMAFEQTNIAQKDTAPAPRSVQTPQAPQSTPQNPQNARYFQAQPTMQAPQNAQNTQVSARIQAQPTMQPQQSVQNTQVQSYQQQYNQNSMNMYHPNLYYNMQYNPYIQMQMMQNQMTNYNMMQQNQMAMPQPLPPQAPIQNPTPMPQQPKQTNQIQTKITDVMPQTQPSSGFAFGSKVIVSSFTTKMPAIVLNSQQKDNKNTYKCLIPSTIAVIDNSLMKAMTSDREDIIHPHLHELVLLKDSRVACVMNIRPDKIRALTLNGVVEIGLNQVKMKLKSDGKTLSSNGVRLYDGDIVKHKTNSFSGIVLKTAKPHVFIKVQSNQSDNEYCVTTGSDLIAL